MERSGLWHALRDHVLIYVHKEEELDDVERWYPARHYVLIDDKLRILDAVKKVWGDRVTTVFARQGHYAMDPAILAQHPPADMQIERDRLISSATSGPPFYDSRSANVTGSKP